jgi:RNA polymerase sigma-70 factor (ECF subfamily)
MLDDVVLRCQSGDKRAFFELFRLYGGMIQKISIRMTHDAEWQRDIFQDVVEQVIDNIKSFRGECKFSTWLYRITVNAALRFLQREGRYTSMAPLDEAASEYGAQEEGILNRLEQKEMFSHTMKVLMSLPTRYKSILSLFYFADRPIEEIAKLTGKSEGAVKALLWKGRRHIIRKLKQQGLLKAHEM